MDRYAGTICCYTEQNMEKIRIHYDRPGNTLTVCFDDPEKQYVCEEIDDDVVLMKVWRGRVLGSERLNYLSQKRQGQGVNDPVEVRVK
jgi:hypothetical protein